MPDRKERKHQSDTFSSYMQQQLKGHRVPPDKSCWEEIEQRLIRRRRALFISRAMCVAAAAALALLLVMTMPGDENTELDYSEIIEGMVSEVEKMEKTDDDLVGDVVAEALPLTPSRGGNHAGTSRSESGVAPEEVIEEVLTELPPEEEKDTVENRPATIQEKKQTELPVFTDRNLSSKTRPKRNWQVSAGMIAMGSMSLANENQLDYQYEDNGNNGGSGGIPTPPDYSIHLRPDECDDINYNLPISFGITARRELGGRLSLETGLVYTYLSTGFKQNSPNRITGKLGLHYLGIPANLIVDLWKDSKWNIYASTGVMMEKGLRSVYKEHISTRNGEEDTTVKTSISGLQWSLNGSLGFSYRFYKDWSLYAEPRISYFFDNNQPISIRTDKPLTVSLGLGIRFDF